MSESTLATRNINNAKRLLEDAMPNQNYELIDQLLSPNAPIVRAGFADLYDLTQDAIPQKGNFKKWIESGWKPLSAALSEQTSEATDIVASDNTVLMKFHMTALHTGTFAGAPATGKRVQWDEITVLHFDAEGKCTSGWFMCQELSLARQIGYTVSLKK